MNVIISQRIKFSFSEIYVLIELDDMYIFIIIEHQKGARTLCYRR